jgi:hypothetical protein
MDSDYFYGFAGVGRDREDFQIAHGDFDLCEGPQWQWRKRLKAEWHVRNDS